MKRFFDKKFRPLLLTALVCAVMYILTQLILTPIYTTVLSNRVYSATILPVILKIVMSFAEILTFGLCYSILIYTAVMRRTRTAAAVCGIYVAASVLRRVAALGVSFMMYHFIDKRDFFNVSIPVIIEALQIFTVFLFTVLAANRYRRALGDFTARRGNASHLEELKMDSVFDRRNPLLVGTLVSAVVLVIVNVSMRIYSDIGYGAPSDVPEILIMIVYYLADVLVGVILYTVCWFALSKLTEKYGSRIYQ